MNPYTGSVGGYEDWYYKDDKSGQEVNAVELGEVIEVEMDSKGNLQEKKR